MMSHLRARVLVGFAERQRRRRSRFGVSDHSFGHSELECFLMILMEK